jgi:hypothetical protein
MLFIPLPFDILRYYEGIYKKEKSDKMKFALNSKFIDYTKIERVNYKIKSIKNLYCRIVSG